MPKRLALLAALAVALVAFVGPAGAITGNYTDDFVHDNVGLLVFYTPNTPAGQDPFSHRCSGTLISPTASTPAASTSRSRRRRTTTRPRSAASGAIRRPGTRT